MSNETEIGNDEKITLAWLVQRPAISAVGLLLGVLSFVATLYFGMMSSGGRELCYEVKDTITTIVTSGHSSELKVLYRGQDVTTDVTAFQVAVWNTGRESIRSENLLSPVVLKTLPHVPILEARIKRVTRQVSQVALDSSQIAKGTLGVKFKILEHDDGALLELIVSGPTAVRVGAEGIVEGQGSLTQYYEHHDSLWHALKRTMMIMLLGALLVVLVYYSVAVISRVTGKTAGYVISSILVAAGVAVFMLFTSAYIAVPIPPSLQ